MEISIIIPVFNKERYIGEILDLIEKQTFTDFECIVIDDGSTDSSGLIIDKYAETDYRIKAIHLEHSGVSKARNAGLDVSQGNYITFIDSDDRVSKEYLENLYSCITSYTVDIVISGVKKYWTDTNKQIIISVPCSGKKNIDEIIGSFAEIQKTTGIFGTCVAKIFPRALVDEIRFDSEMSLGEDLDFYLRLYSVIKTIYFDNKALYEYLQDADNSSVKIPDNKIDYYSQFVLQTRLSRFLIEKNSFTDNNRKIVSHALADYAFWTLRYSDYHSLRQKFMLIRELITSEKIRLEGSGLYERAVLNAINHNRYYQANAIIRIYNFTRRIIRHG